MAGAAHQVWDGPRSRPPPSTVEGSLLHLPLHPTPHISPEPAAATQTGSLLGGWLGGTRWSVVTHGRLRWSSKSRHALALACLDPGAKGEGGRAWNLGSPGCTGPAWNREADVEGALLAWDGPWLKEGGWAALGAQLLPPATLHQPPRLSLVPRPTPRGRADETPRTAGGCRATF